jgi:PAS domain S-box-containing protein
MLVLLLLMAIYAVAKGRLDLPAFQIESAVLEVLVGFLVLVFASFVSFQLLSESKSRRKMVEALRESERRYRTLFERVPVGLYRTTPQGTILDANPSLVEMLGYPDRGTLLAVNASQVYLDPQDRELMNDVLEREGVVNDYEIRLKRYDGSVIWAEDTVRAVLDPDGNMLYYDGSLEDITERKNMERYMLREERLAAMGRISTSLAHEVKNPLQAIRSNLELLLDFPLDTDEREQCLQTCRREVDRLIGIAQRMLTFVRTEKSTVQPFSLPQVWNQVLTLLSGPLKKAEIPVTADFPSNLPLAVGIADQIGQVILNLVLNAVEVIPRGGSLEGVARVEGNNLVLKVINDGPPIPSEHLDKIFDPFFSTKPEGTGLGLFICHSIVEEHGGSLTVENLEGGGVAFKMTMPAMVTEPSAE